MDDNFLHSFIETIAGDLEITPPEIKNELKPTKVGHIATYAALENVIFVAPEEYMENKWDLLLAIVHELRHAYQVEHNPKILEGAIPVGGDTQAYNLHPSEIDANAYASLVMKSMFGVQPLFNGYNDEVKARIKTREKEIVKERQKENN